MAHIIKEPVLRTVDEAAIANMAHIIVTTIQLKMNVRLDTTYIDDVHNIIDGHLGLRPVKFEI